MLEEEKNGEVDPEEGNQRHTEGGGRTEYL